MKLLDIYFRSRRMSGKKEEFHIILFPQNLFFPYGLKGAQFSRQSIASPVRHYIGHKKSAWIPVFVLIFSHNWDI